MFLITFLRETIVLCRANLPSPLKWSHTHTHTHLSHYVSLPPLSSLRPLSPQKAQITPRCCLCQNEVKISPRCWLWSYQPLLCDVYSLIFLSELVFFLKQTVSSLCLRLASDVRRSTWRHRRCDCKTNYYGLRVCVFWKGCQEGFIVGDSLNLFYTHAPSLISGCCCDFNLVTMVSLTPSGRHTGPQP